MSGTEEQEPAGTDPIDLQLPRGATGSNRKVSEEVFFFFEMFTDRDSLSMSWKGCGCSLRWRSRMAVTGSVGSEIQGTFCPKSVSLRGGSLSRQTSARQSFHPEYRQCSTGIFVISAMLPRRHCLKVQ